MKFGREIVAMFGRKNYKVWPRKFVENSREKWSQISVEKLLRKEQLKSNVCYELSEQYQLLAIYEI